MCILNAIYNEINLFSYCDAAEAWQLGVQDPATPVMEGMIYFHNYLIFFLIVIGTFVCWFLYTAIDSFNEYKHSIPKKFTHSSDLEIVWTVVPALLLVVIAIPSFALLYSLDEVIKPSITLKVIGHQWYWSYEYNDCLKKQLIETNLISENNVIENEKIIKTNNIQNKFFQVAFDSYMVNTNDLTKGSFRLLEVDNRVVLPIKTHIRVLISSADVLHSWAIPSCGLKLDACPGRLSQTSLYIKREGIFYGQCSEICGVNHAFMPIVVSSVNNSKFVDWLIYQDPSIVKSSDVEAEAVPCSA